MTKIFRSSFYRSKQPEPPPEEEEGELAAGEYVDLEDGQGKRGKTPGSGGGGGSGDSFTCGIFFTLMGCVFLVCAYLMPKPARDGNVGAMVGAMYLGIGASALAVHACTSWWLSSDSD